MKNFVVLLICLVIGLLSPSCLAENIEEKEYTIMVYMCGSDLQSKNGCATIDRDEMLKSGLDTSKINLILLTGGAKSTGWSEIQCRKLDKTKGFIPAEKTKKFGNNMGEAETLSNFLSYGMTQYPAKKYALILWDHGAGPMEGVCFDENRDMDSISLPELKEALDSLGLPRHFFSWIGIDACLMASLETAVTCAPYADYLIASQETEPAFGWDYKTFLSEITGESTDETITRMIVDNYAKQKNDNLMLTLSCIDLSKVDAITSAADKMFSVLDGKLSGDSFTLFSNERRDSKSFGRATTGSNYDLVDLYHFAQQFEKIAPVESKELQYAIRSAVYSNGNQENAYGISIYSPYYNKTTFTGKWHSEYNSLGLLPSYMEYMEKYSKIWLGDQLGDWSKLIYNAMPVNKVRDTQVVELELTNDQEKHFSSAKVIILKNAETTNAYQKVYESDLLSVNDHKISFEYDFSMLYATSGGTKLTDAIPFEIIDGYYIMTPSLENRSIGEEYLMRLNEAQNGEEKTPWNRWLTILRCSREDESDELKIRSLSIVEEKLSADQIYDNLFLSRETEITELDTELYPYMDFSSILVKRVLKNQDKMLPFNEWSIQPGMNGVQLRSSAGAPQNASEILNIPLSDMYNFGMVDLRIPWSLKFEKAEENERNNLYAQFIITDSQGNEIATELIQLNNENIKSCQIDSLVYFDNINELFLFDSIQGINTVNGVLLRLKFSSLFPSDSSIMPAILELEINGKKVDNFSWSTQMKEEKYYVVEGQLGLYTIDVDVSDIPIINSIKLKGEIIELKETQSGKLGGKFDVLSSFEDEVDTHLDLSQFFDVQGRATNNSIIYRVKDLKVVNNTKIKGKLNLKNSAPKLHTLSLNKEICINDYYIENSWEGLSEIAVLPHGEVEIDFIIHLPNSDSGGLETRESFISIWNIEQIHTLSLFVKDDLIWYSWLDEENYTYYSFEPGYERIDIDLNPYINTGLPQEKTSPKDIMIGQNIALLLGGIKRENGNLCLELMVKNDNPYYTGLDCKMNDKENEYVYYLLENCKVDEHDAVMRLVTDNNDTEWNYYVQLNGVSPHAYKYCKIELARDDGYAIPEDFQMISMSVGYAGNNDTMYHYASGLKILVNDSDSSFISTENMNISPSIVHATIDCLFPDDPSQYMTRLSIDLSQDILEKYDNNEIQSSNVFIISPALEERENLSYHRVYSMIEADCSQFSGTLYNTYSGLLVCPEYSEIPVISKVSHSGSSINTKLDSLIINGYNLNNHQVNYNYAELELYSKRDWKGEPSELLNAKGSVSVANGDTAPTLEYDDIIIILEHLPDGSVTMNGMLSGNISCPYENNCILLSHIPASEFSPLVVFLIQYTDDTYSTLVASYDDIKDDSISKKWFCKVCDEYTRGESCSHCGSSSFKWVCGKCGRENDVLRNPKECKGCGISKSESFIMKADKYLDENQYVKAIPYLEIEANNGNEYAKEKLELLYSKGYKAD